MKATGGVGAPQLSECKAAYAADIINLPQEVAVMPLSSELEDRAPKQVELHMTAAHQQVEVALQKPSEKGNCGLAVHSVPVTPGLEHLHGHLSSQGAIST